MKAINKMTPDQQNEIFIREANAVALKSAKNGFDPFGAILVKDGKIVSSSIDKCIQYSDPTAHAELILISEFCKKNKIISLEGYTIYCNVEPCIMCSGAIHWSKISKVVFGVSQSTLQLVSKGNPKPNCRDLINSGNKEIEIYGPILEEESKMILEQFPFTSKKAKHDTYYKK